MTHRRGFTVVEIVVGLAIAIVVLGLALTLLNRAALTVWRTEDRIDAREHAHLALVALRRELGDAWHYAVAGGGAGVAFHGPRKGGEVTFDKERRRLRLRPAGHDRTVDLIAADVEAFTVTALRPGYLRLTLSIARKKASGPLHALGPLEVTEEVFLPCIALRDPSIPWSRALEHRKALEPSV